MGITNLTSFINDKVPNGIRTINLLEEIRQHRLDKNNENPIIVLDFNSFARVNIDDIVTVLCGLRWKSLARTIENFIQRLKAEGAELVFFIGNNFQEEKIGNILLRNNAKYDRECKALDIIKGGYPLEETTKFLPQTAFEFFKNYLENVLRKYGTWHKAIFKDVDLDIARYAKENNVFAVFTNDSDFLIFKGNYRLWSNPLNYDEMTTKETSKSSLHQALGLNEDQMPLFGTLAGSDFIKKTKLYRFYNKLADQYNPTFKIDVRKENRFELIAKFIITRKFPLKLNSSEILNISRYANVEFEVFKACLEQFENEFVAEDVEEDSLLSKVRKDFHFLYKVLANEPVCIRCLFENNEQLEFGKSQFELGLQLEQCLTSVFLPNNKARKIITKKPHHTEYQLCSIIAEPLPQHIVVPPIEELIYRQEKDGWDSNRFKILAYSLKLDIQDIQRLMTLDKNFIMIVATLCFLKKETNITVKEADAFLITYYNVNQENEEMDIPLQDHINPRSFQLFFLFIHIQDFIKRLLSAFGFKDVTTELPFDGVYFHHLLENWETMELSGVMNEVENLRLYSNLK